MEVDVLIMYIGVLSMFPYHFHTKSNCRHIFRQKIVCYIYILHANRFISFNGTSEYKLWYIPVSDELAAINEIIFNFGPIF